MCLSSSQGKVNGLRCGLHRVQFWPETSWVTPSYFLFLVIAGDSAEDPEENLFVLFKGSDKKYFRHLVSVAITHYYHCSRKSVTDNV